MSLPVLNLGFRIFFLGAAIFSIVSISFWLLIYSFNLPIHLEAVSVYYWHAHEMIYGYSLAVIAGFLLTAVKNWTGIQTVRGSALLILFCLWAAARMMWLFGTQLFILAALFDLLFAFFLIICVCGPVIKASQWRQLAILPKLVLIAVFNLLFYLGALGFIEQGEFLGIYGGLYLIIGLILTMGRRVLPMFIQSGVGYLGYRVNLFNSRWLDISSLVLFLGFFISELFLKNTVFTTVMALCLFVINAIRLAGWHTFAIWKRSLLWSLYLSLWFICTGFLLIACSYVFGISKFIAVHAFAVGGIGVVTMAMMSRVSIGHSGRDVHNPPVLLSIAFILLLSAAFFRVIIPLFSLKYYSIWIGLSQLLWITAFLIFIFVFFPILIKPRIDGRPG